MPRKPSNFDKSKIPCLFELMNKQGLTAKELSVKTGISETSISDWRKGISAPTIDYLIILANTLNVSIDYLVGRTDAVTVNGGEELDALELRLITAFRSMSPEDRHELIGRAEYIAEQTEKAYKQEDA